ncbi:unnamed protein product [Dicrocoelium dendriticum]|nr:unnamed protein product [Dicrocoelium dendriticum]
MEPPVAPALDEIICDSDEENDVSTELLSPGELRDRLLHLWQNEKVAPELLTAHSDLLGLVQEEAEQLEAQAKSLPAGDLRAQLKFMQAERLRFILADYMRTRIFKIEQFVEHILAEERARPDNDSPHLTAEEFLFAKSYTNSIKDYLKHTILNRLPVNMQSIKDEDLAFRPNLNSYVFCRALSRLFVTDVPTHSRDTQSGSTSVDLEPGEQHLLPYSAVRSFVEDGRILLL